MKLAPKYVATILVGMSGVRDVFDMVLLSSVPWAPEDARYLYLAVSEIGFSSVPVRYLDWVEAFFIGSQENKSLRQMRDISASPDGYSATTRMPV